MVNKVPLYTGFHVAKQSPAKSYQFAVFVSLLVASVLLFLPLSLSIAAYRPQMMFLVTLFWVIVQPHKLGIWFAFCIGLLCDILLDTHVGQNALAFCTSAFFIDVMNERKERLAFFLNWIYALVGICCYAITLSVIDFIMAQRWQLDAWKPVLSSILVWPLVYAFLHRYKK